MRRFPVIVGAVTCTLATTAGALAASPGVSGAAGNAQATYKAALAYAATQNVHYVSKATQGAAVLSVTGDTSPTAGTQSLIVKSTAATETLTTALIGKTGYVRGNGAGLAHILGLTAAEATTYTNKWLSFPTGNQQLDALVSGLRNKDVAAELKMSGPFSFGPATTIGGQSAQAVQGFISDSTGKKVATTHLRSVRQHATPPAGSDHLDPGQNECRRVSDLFELGTADARVQALPRRLPSLPRSGWLRSLAEAVGGCLRRHVTPRAAVWLGPHASPRSSTDVPPWTGQECPGQRRQRTSWARGSRGGPLPRSCVAPQLLYKIFNRSFRGVPPAGEGSVTCTFSRLAPAARPPILSGC